MKYIRKVKRKEIIEIPYNIQRGDEDYYRIEIRQWRKLANPIRISRGIRTVAFTNLFLLKHAESSQELYLRSEEAYRFLIELKRYVADASVIRDDDRPQGFEFGRNKVFFQDGEIKLIQDGRLFSQCKVEDFIKRPNAEFKDMMRMMKSGKKGIVP